MKQRALPQSFWQQPNVANPQPPGVVCSALPALPLGAPGGAVGPGDDGGGGGVDITPVEEVASQLQLRDPLRKSIKNKKDLIRSIIVSVRECCADWIRGIEPHDDPALKGKKDPDGGYDLKVRFRLFDLP